MMFVGASQWTRRSCKRITVNPKIFGGKPLIRGRGLTVEHVVGMLAVGDTTETILRGYAILAFLRESERSTPEVRCLLSPILRMEPFDTPELRAVRGHKSQVPG